MAEFLELAQPVIIAMKGLPCTGKSEIGWAIDCWARCPIFYIDSFLDALSLEKGYTAEFMPTPDQAELLHRLSFDALCKVASNSLHWVADKRYNAYKCVIIKSRLCSTFELDRLLQLARECGCGMILIIEFQMKNEYRFRCRLEDKVEAGTQKEWYKPRSWKDIDKAKDDYDANNWDLHLRHLLGNADDLPPVTRLVLDPFDHLYLSAATIPDLTAIVINFLLSRVKVGNHESDDKEDDLYLKGRYTIVQYTEVGRHLRAKDLRRPRSKKHCDNEYLCYANDEDTCTCVLKYWEELQLDVGDEDSPYHCGVCEETVILGQPAYGCIVCSLTLHKSCAEKSDNNVTLEGYKDIEFLRLYPKRGLKGHACNSCLKGGKEFSSECRSCNFQTHLKCGKLPTILNHDCHDHFLFIRLHQQHKCMACGVDRVNPVGGYGCYICFIYYDIECVSLVREVEHEHGGHQHSLKLVYSRDGIEEEEAYWCDICYEDMDPQNWFYTCQHCPYFEAHPNCVRFSIN